MLRLPIPPPIRAALSGDEHLAAMAEIRGRLERLGFQLGEELKLNPNRGRVIVRCGPDGEYIAKLYLRSIYAPLRHLNHPENEIKAHMELANSTAFRMIPRGISSDEFGIVMERVSGLSLPEYVLRNSDCAIEICEKVIERYLVFSQEPSAAFGHIDVRRLASAEVHELWRVAFQTDATLSRLLAHKLAAERHIERECWKAIERLSACVNSSASSLTPVFASRDLVVKNIMVAETDPIVIDWDNAGATFLEFEIATYVASVVALFLQAGRIGEAQEFISLSMNRLWQAENINGQVFAKALSVYFAAMQINPTLWDNFAANCPQLNSFAQTCSVVRRLREFSEVVLL